VFARGIICIYKYNLFPYPKQRETPLRKSDQFLPLITHHHHLKVGPAMTSSGLSLIPMCRSSRGSILVIYLRLFNSVDSSSIRSIASPHITGSSMSGQSIGVFCANKFSITLWLALPELSPWGTGCVTVVGGGTEGLFFLVVLDEAELNKDGEEEENASHDRNRESSSLKLASCSERRKDSDSTITTSNRIGSPGVSISERCSYIAGARTCTTSCSPRNINESSRESQIKEHSNQAQDGDSSKTAY